MNWFKRGALAALAVGALMAPVHVAEAHRVHSSEWVANRMQWWIRKNQCQKAEWDCWQTVKPIPTLVGRHSWGWNGTYYSVYYGASVENCQTSGIYADHTIYWTTKDGKQGPIFSQGDTFHNATKSGPHC